MFGRDYIFKHRQTFMRAFTAHAQDLLPNFLTRTPLLRDYLETAGDRVTDAGGVALKQSAERKDRHFPF